MTLDLGKLLLLGILCAALHWLIARAEITAPLWSRAPGKLDKLLRCSGCSGFWLGLLLGALGLRPIEGLHTSMLITGVLGAFVTPVFEGLLLWGLTATTLHDLEETEDAEEAWPALLSLDDAHGIAHEIAEEMWPDPDEETVDKLTNALMRAINPPDVSVSSEKPS